MASYANEACSSSKRKAEPETQSAPSNKKTKQNEPASIKRSEKYWFNDGNVVVQIDHTQFQLYRGQLARASKFFADLFSSEVSARLGDLPLFRLTNVTARDFALLLAWLFDSIPIFTATEWPIHPVVASILRASVALDFPSLRDAATHILLDMWNPDLQDYLDDTEKSFYAADAVILAKECGLPAGILKRAYCSLLTQPELDQDIVDTDETSKPMPLPSSEVYLLTRARVKLLNAWDDVTILPATLTSCPSRKAGGRDACESLASTKAAWEKIVYQGGLAREWKFNPIEGLNRLQNADWAAEGVCGRCIESVRDEWKAKQEEIWSDLDEWLDLDAA